jgi:hypothetical protein
MAEIEGVVMCCMIAPAAADVPARCIVVSTRCHPPTASVRHPRDAGWVILGRMKHALLALALSGCVTTAGIVKKQDVALPLLIGAVVADMVVISAAASQIQDYSYGASLATGLAITAVDVAVGCLIGACSSLKL